MKEEAFPKHVALMGQALKPALALLDAALADPLVRPAPPAAPGSDASAALALAVTRLGTVARGMQAAIGGLTTDIVGLDRCPDTAVYQATGKVAQAAALLVDAWEQARRLSVGAADQPRREALVAAGRDVLVTIARWLANVVLVAAQPWRIAQMGGQQESSGKISIDLNCNLHVPGSVEDLDHWQAVTLACDRGHVHDALNAAPTNRGPTFLPFLPVTATAAEPIAASEPAPPPPPPPRKKEGLGFWATLGWVLLGAAALDAIFDADGDCDPHP